MNTVKVYTTTTCPYCVMMKNFLAEQKIPFQEINVEEEPNLMHELVEKTGQMGVPQTEINGNWVLGFDPNGVIKHLN